MRTLAERARDPIWWLEQVLHTALGAAIAYAFAPDLPWWGSTTVSFGLCVARELLQNLRRDKFGWYWDGSKGDSAADSLFWFVGAAIASAVA